MTEYLVSIELAGQQTAVGTLESADGSEAVFRYSEDYLARPGVCPISLSLPLQREAFTAAQTRRYFEGLLPEGFTRRSVAQWMHTSENDYLGILHGLGRECLGAVRISEPGESPEASYEKLDPGDVKRLAEEGAGHSAEIVVESHLSLTGASGKVGLYYDSESGSWYLPKGTAPSTHILKQSHVRLGGIVVNEQLSLLTARKCGLAAAPCFIVNIGSGNDAEILLASRRFDRRFPAEPRMISGLPAPLRLHQEDLAQALGIPSEQKYEPAGAHYMARMFGLLRRCSADPVADQLALWDALVFHWLIGNTDGHIKNFSLLYSADMRGLRLAPAYDIVSTAVYPSCTRSMAFSIGGRQALGEIGRDSFREAAREAGLGTRMAMARFDRLCQAFQPALQESAEELGEAGLPGCSALMERILQQGGWHDLK